MDTEHLLGAGGAVSGQRMTARRVLFFGLVSVTIFALVSALAYVFAAGGLRGIEIAMIVVFALNTPWMVIGFWNAVIGFSLLHFSPTWLQSVTRLSGLDDDSSQVCGRTAIIMPVHNENPDLVVGNLKAVTDSLDATGLSDTFDIFLLSDTTDPVIAGREKALFTAWREGNDRPDRLHYRRRTANSGQKVGNIQDFCARWGDGFDFMIVLDADSVMSGAAILRLVRLMQHNPALGILQTLVTGMPANSAFARMFQFGMRHGMRSYTTGSAWWQGPDGPYWGHNAILRLEAFRRNCGLPMLPGRRPLGGEILSHDQVEAVFMRRAGYEVRVLPLEDGSYEENPTTLPDYLTRDLRWCQGNMQYLKLFRHPSLIRGVRPMGRLQLLLAIMMYTGAPLWFAFMALGLIDLCLTTVFNSPDVPVPEASGLSVPGFGIALFIVVMGMTFAPKIFGVLDMALRREGRRSYGGVLRIVAGTLLETLFSLLLSPVVALAQTVFVLGLFFGKRIRWDAQERDDRRVRLREALAGLWLQTALGLTFFAALVIVAPNILPWAAPVVLGLTLSVPFAVVTALPVLGRFFRKYGLCAIPEESLVPEVLRSAQLALPQPELAEIETRTAPTVGPLVDPERA